MTLTQIQKMRRQSGFTLVELLIVMLIVGILSIAMLPMYKKYMTKAKYTAEGLPILATIKTQVDLDIYDKSYAPGTADTVYTWKETSGTGYEACTYELGTDKVGVGDYSVGNDDNGYHIRRLIKESDLQGKLIRPNHVFYACINQGKAKTTDATESTKLGGDYAYAIGVFGDGNGLPQNSGVATMEVRLGSPKVGEAADSSGDTTDTRGVTILGTWENFDGSGLESADEDTYGQIRFAAYGGEGTGVCEIWQNSDVNETLNKEEVDFSKIKEEVDKLINGSCGEWTFPDYTNVAGD